MTAKVEEREGDQGFGGLEPERDPGDQADLGVGRLDESVGQVVLDRGQDPGAVFDDALLQLHECRDPAAAGPADPPVQGVDGFPARGTCPSTGSLGTRSGWRSSRSPPTYSSGPSPSPGTTTLPAAGNPSTCACDCSRSQNGSPGLGDDDGSGCPTTGPGTTSSTPDGLPSYPAETSTLTQRTKASETGEHSAGDHLRPDGDPHPLSRSTTRAAAGRKIEARWRTCQARRGTGPRSGRSRSRPCRRRGRRTLPRTSGRCSSRKRGRLPGLGLATC